MSTSPLRFSALPRLLAVLALMLAGGSASAQQTITRNVTLGGVMDISPIANAFPPGDYARMYINLTTVPGVTRGTLSRTQFGVETPWGTGGSEPFGPATAPTFTQHRIQGTQGLRFTNDGTGLGTSVNIPVTLANSTGSSSAPYTLVINIVPPAGAPQITTQPVPLQTVSPNTTATLTVVASGNAPLSYQWYEGQPPSTLFPMAGATSATFTMPGRPVGQYRFWVRVSNSVSSVNSAEATVKVSSPPTARIGGPYTVGELETITLSGLSSTDPDQASNTLSFKWDSDNNNIYGLLNSTYGPETGATPAFTAVDLEGPGTHPLRVQVSDNTDNLAYDSGTITIVNSPPRAVFTTNGTPGLVTFSNFVDSPGDLAAGFQFSYDLDGNGTFEVPYSSNASAAMPAVSLPAYLNGQPVRGRIQDRDGGVSEYIAHVHGRGVVVTTLADENNGGAWELNRAPTSLREAITLAQADNSPTAILFDPALFANGFATLPCYVTYNVSTPVAICGPITGNGIILTGGAADARAFTVASTGTLILDRVTLTKFTTAQPAAGASGGAIFSEGALIVRRSTLHGNRVSGSGDIGGGAIYSNNSSVILENSTLFDNQAIVTTVGRPRGGTIYARNSTLTISQCTLSSNSNALQRGIYLLKDGPAGTASAAINNTIIADATSGGMDFVAEGVNGGSNPASSGTDNIMRGVDGFDGTFTNANPVLTSLGFFGGPTPMLSLLRGSPAINRGAVMTAFPTDQRGFVRPFAKRYDIGAMEFDGLIESLLVTTTADEDDGTSDSLVGAGTSLREAMIFAGDRDGADTITFAAALGGQTLTLNTGWTGAADESALRVRGAINVDGLNTSPGIRIQMAQGVPRRHFLVEPGNTLQLSRLHLTGGSVAGAGGSVWNRGTLRIFSCTFSANAAGQEGGAVQCEDNAPLCYIENSTFSGNTTSGVGSALYSASPQSQLRHLTVTGNFGSNALVFRHNGVELRNSLVIGNNSDDISLLDGAIVSPLSTNNILGGGGAGGLINGVLGNLTGVPLMAVRLGALANNGGPAPTVALEPGSIAVNLGVAIPGITVDQRGTVRPTGAAPDVGAFEDTIKGGAGDGDLDTVTNYAEFLAGSDPLKQDTDGDGYNDGTEQLAGTSLLSAASVPPVNHVERVLGYGPGRGLDLAGSFLYAVNTGTNGAPGKAGSANFTADNSAGITVTAPNEAPAWFPADFGLTAADDIVENVYRSIRWGVPAQPVTATLTNLDPGRRYKLQLLFGEACCANRVFDIFVGGNLAVDNFRPADAQGGATMRYSASAVVYEFTAMSSTLSIVLDGSKVPSFPGVDPNPILNGLTLEEGAFVSALAAWRNMHGLAFDGSQDFENPSRDGVSNLVKYAFNLASKPGELNRSNLPAYIPGNVYGLPLIQSHQSGPMVFDFLRRKASTIPEINLLPRVSTDLVNWQPLSLEGATITSVNSVWERVTLAAPATEGSRLFGSVEVVRTGYTNDFSAAPAAALRGTAAWADGTLRLTDNRTGETGTAVLEGVTVGQDQTGFEASFSLTTGSTGGTSADGVSFSVGDPGTAAWGDAGPGMQHSLTIVFDTFENVSGPGGARGIRILNGNDIIATSTVDPYTDGVSVPVVVSYRADTGLTLTFNGVTVFTAEPVPGFAIQSGDRYSFGARSGEFAQRNTVDNVIIGSR